MLPSEFSTVFGIREGDTGIFRVRCLSKSCAKVSMETIVGHELHHPGLTVLQKIKSQDPHMGVSKNRGTPKSSILIGFSITNHPFWVPLFSEHPYLNFDPSPKSCPIDKKMGTKKH